MQFTGLQSLRGIFALLIFFHHFSFLRNGEPIFAAGGDLGVAFFFILSGFVLSCGFMEKSDSLLSRNTYPRFITRRLSKIYPLHLLCLFLALALRNFDFSIPDLANIFLLQAWIPDSKWFFSGNAVGWCLSDFLFFYSVFPFLCLGMKKSKSAFILSYSLILLIYLSLIVPFIPAELQDGIIYISPITRILDFIFGMMLWEFFKNYETKVSPVSTFRNFTFLCGCLILISVSIAVWYVFSSSYNLSILWWPSISLLILYSVSAGNRLLSFSPLVKFGDISFSFYLIHVLCINYTDRILDKLQLAIHPLGRLILVLTVTLIASIILHRYFVLPLERFIRNRFGNQKLIMDSGNLNPR